MPRAFISYSRKDTEFVRRLYQAFELQGLSGWVDWEGIPPADDWLRKVRASIEGADAFVFVMSPDSLISRVCADEIAHAVRHNKRLVPVVFREVNRSDHPGVEIPEALRRVNWIFCRETDDFHAAITKIVAAIRTDLDWVRSHTRLLGRAIEWDAAERDDSFLLQKNDLLTAEQWLAQGPDKDPRPTALQTDYIIASRAEATRRQRRLTTAALAAIVLVGIGAVVATVQYVIAEMRREVALSRQLAAQSASAMDDDPELGLLLGVYAHDVAPTNGAADALLSAVDRVRGVQAFLPGEYEPGTLALAADGELMAVGRCRRGNESGLCGGPSVELWRVTSLERIAAVDLGLPVWRTAFSPDGKRLVVTVCCDGEPDSGDGRTVTFDLASAAPTLIKAAEQPFKRSDLSGPELLGSPAKEAFERIRRASGAIDDKLSVIPASNRPAARLLTTISGADSAAPVRLELWDAEGSPRRLAQATMQSHLWGDTILRADGRFAAAFGCAFAASGRICSEAQLVIIDDTGEHARTAIASQDLPDWIRTFAVLPGEPQVLSGGCGKYEYQNCRYGELRLWRVQDEESKPSSSEPMRTYGGAVESIGLSADGKTFGVISQRGKVALMKLNGPVDSPAAWLASPLATRRAPAPAEVAPSFHCGKNHSVEKQLLRRLGAQLQDKKELCDALASMVPGINQTTIDGHVVAEANASGTLIAIGGCAARNSATRECQAGRAIAWSIVGGRLKRLATAETAAEVTTLAFAPDGKVLAVASCSGDSAQDCTDGRLELIDLVRAGGMRRTLGEKLGLVTAIAFQPGNGALAYASCARLEDVGAVRGCALGSIRVLSMSQEALDWTQSGHRAAVTAIAFAPHGALLVSAGDDGSIAFWDAKRGERLGPVVAALAKSIEAIRFRSAEAFISSADAEEIEWRATPAQWKRVACMIANRTFSEEEHKRFIGAEESFRNACADTAPPRGSALWRWLRDMVGGTP
jgi:hypothetical protein